LVWHFSLFSRFCFTYHGVICVAIPRAGTPLNPEYSIEVHSPGSAQHDSDDEMWVINGINGSRLQALDGGLGALD
jgi:hypothetical protein